MRTAQTLLLLIVLLFLAGCTEMRVEGDAKVFQSSAAGAIIRTVIGIGLISLGVASFVSSVLPDRKPPNRPLKSEDKLTTTQRTGLALFGFAMSALGIGLALIPLLFTKKLHVSVYPDRVEMASTYSQTGGNEVVVAFADVTSVEIRDEPSGIGKFKKFLVFGTLGGREIKQPASNNEMQSLETIQTALAEFQSQRSPSGSDSNRAIIAANMPVPSTQVDSNEPPKVPAFPDPAVATVPPLAMPRFSSDLTPLAPSAAEPQAAEETPAKPQPEPQNRSVPDRQYSLKRYLINIPVPEDRIIVEADTVVPIGTKLQACYAKSWEFVTVVAINDDGTITCNWDNWKAFTYKMMREDLIIDKSKAESSESVK